MNSKKHLSVFSIYDKPEHGDIAKHTKYDDI